MPLSPGERQTLRDLLEVAGDPAATPTPLALTISELAICLMLARRLNATLPQVVSALQDAKADVLARLQGG